MCGFAAASLAFQGLSAVQSFMGQRAAGKAAQAEANYAAAVNRNNKILSDRQAEDAIQRGKIAENEQRQRVQQIKGTQRTAFASRNIDLGSEDVIETISDTAMLGELDALTIRSNAEREAQGFRINSMNYEASARNNELAGKNARKAANTAATGTLLSGLGTVAGKYSDYKASGALK